MTKVSVIIPAFNAMQYIETTLNSVLQQTFIDFEVLIIDDGSSDSIAKWASEIKDSRVKLISQENQGLSGARNKGIWCSQGEYLAFLDADDIWEPTKLEKQVQCLEQNLDIGLVGCWISHIDENGDTLNFCNVPTFEGIELRRELFIINIILCGSTPMVRRSCFEKTGFFERSLSAAADWDMWLRIAKYYPISVIQKHLVRYRQHSSNMSKNLRAMLYENDEVMKRTFELPPSEFKHLKGVGASLFSIRAAWECIIKDDINEAFWFIKQALIRRPILIFSTSFIHLILLFIAKRFISPYIYKVLHSFLFKADIAEKRTS